MDFHFSPYLKMGHSVKQFEIFKMLPDFPKIKSRWSKIFLKFVKEQMQRDSITAKFKTIPHFEGDRMSTKHDEGDVDKSGYSQFSAELRVSKDDIIKLGFKAFIKVSIDAYPVKKITGKC